MPAPSFLKDGKVWIKAGPKEKHIPIPDGWELVKEGKCKKGDKYLYCRDLFKTVSWNFAVQEDVGCSFEEFEALIRK